MNLPYQSCPFCVPNTTQLSNTMAVYAKDGDSFEFTDRAIKVVGTLEFGDYTDEYGYEYAYRIKDATYTEVDTSEMGEKLQLWQQLASTDVISDVYNMYEYVNFLCFWPTYTAEFEGGKDYLYPTDALRFIETDGAQYNYGYADGYFEGMIATIKEVNATEFNDLIENITKAQTLAEKIAKTAQEKKAEEIVVGLPRNMDGSKGFRAEACEALGQLIRECCEIPVVFWDERLTTVSAHRILNDTNVRGKKRKSVVDAVAAEIILQDYIDFRKNR
jgi:putative Holliday junction resolvase